MHRARAIRSGCDFTTLCDISSSALVNERPIEPKYDNASIHHDNDDDDDDAY